MSADHLETARSALWDAVFALRGHHGGDLPRALWPAEDAFLRAIEAVRDARNPEPMPTGSAALVGAALALRAANSAEAGRAPVQRTWLRAVLADALEALAAGDDAEAVQHVVTGAAELRAKREAV